MATYTVKPAPDGYDLQGNWVCKGPGKTTPHTSKQAAMNEARRRGSLGDTIRKHYQNGRFQETITISSGGASSSDDSDSRGFLYGEKTVKDAFDV